MTRFTEAMKEAAEHSPIFVMATADKEGKPNGVPIGLGKIISEDQILLVDNFMNKTLRNIKENPVVAVSFWSARVHGNGYQFKGRARVENGGKDFNAAMQWLKTKTPPPPHQPKGVVIISVDEIYYIGANVDSGVNLAGLPEE